MDHNPKKLFCGSAPGIHLGPLLFLIYMNDIPPATEYFIFILYADETTLFTNEQNLLINGELLKVNDWLVANRLSLDVNKIKYRTFHNSQEDISNFPST